MTSSQIPSRKAFLKPFASDGLITDFPDTDGEIVNISTGFPSPYSAPGGSGGRYVGRGDINAIGNLATNDLFYHKCGGLNTFDAAFAEKVGGYPKGAILDLVEGNSIFRVMSMEDNNTVDYTMLGVDGVHWIYCNEKEPVRERLEMLSLKNVPVGFGLPTAGVDAATAVPVGAFYATKSGALIVDLESEVTMTMDRTENYYPEVISSNVVCGIGVLAIQLNNDSEYSSLSFPNTTQLRDASTDWKLLSEDAFGIIFRVAWSGCAIGGRITNVSALRAQAGKYYVIAVLAGSANAGAVNNTTPAKYIEGSLTSRIDSLKVFID